MLNICNLDTGNSFHINLISNYAHKIDYCRFISVGRAKKSKAINLIWTMSCTCNPENQMNHVDQILRHFETHHESDKKGPKLAREMATAIFKFYQENPFVSGDRLNILMDITRIIKVEKVKVEERKEQELPQVDDRVVLKLTPEEERSLDFFTREVKCEKQLVDWNPVDLTLGQTVEVGGTANQSNNLIKKEVKEEVDEEQLYQLMHPDFAEEEVSSPGLDPIPPWHLWNHTSNQYHFTENPPWSVNLRQFRQNQNHYHHTKSQQDYQL